MYTAFFFLVPLVAWGIYYNLTHKRLFPENQGHPGVMDMGTFNGVGALLTGGFSTVIPNLKVYYEMITIFYLPICPIKCILASKKDSSDSWYLVASSTETEYGILCKTNWNGWEVFSIYAIRWGILFLVVNSIALFTS